MGCGAGALAASELGAADEPPLEELGCADDAAFAALPPLALLGLLPLLEHPAKISAAEKAAAAQNDEYQERLNQHLRIIGIPLLGWVQHNTERASKKKGGGTACAEESTRRVYHPVICSKARSGCGRGKL